MVSASLNSRCTVSVLYPDSPNMGVAARIGVATQANWAIVLSSESHERPAKAGGLQLEFRTHVPTPLPCRPVGRLRPHDGGPGTRRNDACRDGIRWPSEGAHDALETLLREPIRPIHVPAS